jgi:signal transduction histidine kinase
VATAWFFGARAGIVAGLATLPLNMVLALIASDSTVAQYLEHGGIFGTVAEVFVGAVVGLVHDLMAKARDAAGDRVERARALARAEELQKSRQRVLEVAESLRRETAHYLHGTVQSKLILVLFRVKEIRALDEDGRLAEKLDGMESMLNQLIEEDVREISHRLYPAILKRGLTPALQSLSEQFEAAMAVQLDIAPEIAASERGNSNYIPEKVRLTAYRVAEEAMTNAIKHASASKILVSLGSTAAGWLRLTVRDNGKGFDGEKLDGSMGLGTMADYAESVGGSCSIDSTPGKGTEIIAVLPMSSASAS